MPPPADSLFRPARSVLVLVDALPLKERVPQRLGCRDPLARVELERLLEKIKGKRDRRLVVVRVRVRLVRRPEVRVRLENDRFKRVAGVVDRGDVGQERSAVDARTLFHSGLAEDSRDLHEGLRVVVRIEDGELAGEDGEKDDTGRPDVNA